uniref:Uncharacterized protein n=1 Tax=Panagrolaimus superbus TaxID=310955 RepID=A0A914ZBN5_9BILA
MVNKTHIANGCDRDIFAMTDMDRNVHTKELKAVSAGFKDLGNIEAKEERCNQIFHIAESRGFTKIRPGLYLPFEPSGEGCVYISIVTHNDDGNLHVIASAFPQGQNHSVIVGDDIQIYAAKMGEIWIDDNDRKFGPEK